MNRTDFESYISTHYGITCDHPFADDTNTVVFRHPNNRKWFALVMNIPKNKLEADQSESIDVVNLKCPTEIIDSFWSEQGIYPAYHMNKRHWLTVLLDGSVNRDIIIFLLELSYALTQTNQKSNLKQTTSDEW